jgi:VWFA-related protein
MPSMAVLQRFGLAWMLLAFCPQSLLAQGNTASVHVPDAQAPAQMSLLDAGRGLIHLDVAVTDQSGNPVPGLSLNDFTLLDNGRPQKVLSFHAFDESARSDPPLKIILVIDTLDLPGRFPSDERLAVEAFLQKNGGQLTQPVSLYELSAGGFSAVGSTSTDGNTLASDLAHSQNLHQLRSFRSTLRGETWKWMNLNDTPSLEALKAIGDVATIERQLPGRKLLIWVGPGWGIGTGAYAEGTASREDTFYTIRWFSSLLREARITFYSLSVGETEPSRLYLNYLHGVPSPAHASFMSLYRKVLAEQSGGHVLNTSFDLVGQIESCVHEPNTFYTLSFDPPPTMQQNEYHDLNVQINKPGLNARTNTGYYDQPYYSDQPSLTIRSITSEQLGRLLTALYNEPDAKAAHQLSELVLTDRPGMTTVESWTTSLHGKSTRQELTALIDASAFQNPSPSTISTDPPPDASTQQQMILSGADYLAKTIPRLPNFYARRTTVRYQDTPPVYEGDTRISYEPLHVAQTAEEMVLYRDGKEIVDAGAASHKKQKMADRSLVTYGTFGPILRLAQDVFATPASLTWARWEQDGERKRAVFRYAVPVQKSRYDVWGCCLPDGDGMNGFDVIAPYHGEIWIDPASGVVVRLEAIADLGAFVPLRRSDIVVEYGAVEIGGKTYICPVRSVSVMTSRSVMTFREWDEGFRTFGPYATTMNDITFDSYHVFRAESRILVGINPSPGQSPDRKSAVPRSQPDSQ